LSQTAENRAERSEPLTDQTESATESAAGPVTESATGPAAGPFATLHVEHSTTVDRVAEELRRALFHGELESGTPLREVALTDAMGVSRSTVREALGVLVAEGLATREPNRGVFVTELDPEAVHDVARARAVVEVSGVRCWDSAAEESRDAVRRALADFDEAAASGAAPSELTAAHLAIHRGLAGLNESARLLALADALYAEIRLGLAKVDRIRRNTGEQVHSHRRLLTLLEQGDVDAAARDLAEHLAHAETSMLEALHLPAPDAP
jgi:DNA-binding GntR family transcriptional regulator